MKKITALLAGLMLVAFLGVAHAATFSDVDPSHWAYEAITKLENLGVVEGYPDGTFKGNRTFTRYEMAMVVARLHDTLDALITKVKFDTTGLVKKSDLDDIKSIINKLSAEFKDELAALGVKVDELGTRVSALEKDVNMLKNFLSTVKVSGTLRQRVIVPGTDVGTITAADQARRNYFSNTRNDQIAQNWIPVGGPDFEAGYEMFYYLAIEGMAGDNIEVLIELNNYAVDSQPTGANTRSPLIDQAYVAMDFSENASELDVLGITAGFQYFAFGPYGLLVDNGFEAEPTVRLDMAKDRVSVTGIAGLMNQNALQTVTRDAYYAARLGIDLDAVQLGVNFLGSGGGNEKGWGADVDAELFDGPWITGLTAEYMNLFKDQRGVKTNFANNNNIDQSYIVGVDVYTTSETAVKFSYGHVGLTPYYTGADIDPFSEFSQQCFNLGTGANDHCTMAWESGSIIFPNNFKGFGAEASQKVLKDTVLRFKAWRGDYMDGVGRPAYAEIGVTKPINSNATFGIDYKQYGVKNVLANMVRGELLVNF